MSSQKTSLTHQLSSFNICWSCRDNDNFILGSSFHDDWPPYCSLSSGNVWILFGVECLGLLESLRRASCTIRPLWHVLYWGWVFSHSVYVHILYNLRSCHLRRTWGRAPLCMQINIIGTERRAQVRPPSSIFELNEPWSEPQLNRGWTWVCCTYFEIPVTDVTAYEISSYKKLKCGNEIKGLRRAKVLLSTIRFFITYLFGKISFVVTVRLCIMNNFKERRCRLCSNFQRPD